MSDIVGKIKVALGIEVNQDPLNRLNAQFQRIEASAQKLKGTLNQTAHSAAAFNGSGPRALGSGLSAATAKATEFSKAIEASNARVLAFAASAGAMFQVVNALKMVVRSSIDIEKKLMDVNVILGESKQGLEKFSAGLFQISRSTAQSFEVVAEAATELARQGLSTEETLKRTKDALILTRLSGMDAAASVSSLTAALNTFNKEGLTSTQVINKMAMVDSAFAVSTTDLAESMRRVGSTAQDVGVSFDQLLAVTAALQQKTARGGPVIGNALKSIFTRIQRTETLDELEGLGVAVRDLSGEMLPAMSVLQNMANVFPTLSKAQQAHTAEIVGSVFQMNNLRALLQDLGGGYSIYKAGLDKANSATDEAIERNELLNTTLSARLIQTYSKLTSVAQKFGDVAFRPAMERLVDSLSGALGTLEPDEDAGKSFGDKIGKGMLSGLGDFIAGPGLATVIVVLGKLAGNVTTFMRTAVAEFLGIQTKTLQIKQIQESLNALYSKQPELIRIAAHSTEARILVEQHLLNLLVEQGNVMAAQKQAAGEGSARMYAQNLRAKKPGQWESPLIGQPPVMVSSEVNDLIGRVMPQGKGGKRKAFGHVPNFNRTDATMETIGAISGGYMPGKIQQMDVPGLGKITYNGREEVKHVPGFSQPFINPPEHSKAGKLHKSSAIRKTGINPYAANGFLPNFAGAPKSLSHLIESLKADGLKGKTFYVEYLKKNGEIAQRTGRLGAYKPPITNGVGAQYDPLEYNLLRYFDMGRGAYRHAKYDNIRKIHFGSSKYQRNEKGEFESYAAAGFIPNFASGRFSPKTDWRHSRYLTKRASLRNEAQAAKEKAAREHHPLTERPQYEAKLQRVFNGLHPALREKLADADLLNYAPPVRLPSAHIPSDQGQQYIKNFFENIPDTFAVRGHQAGKFEGQAVKRLHKPSAPLEPGAALHGEASISGVDRWSTKGLSKKTTGIDSLNELETVFMANSGRNRPGWGSFTGSVDVARRFAAESGSMMHRGTSEEVSEALVSRMNARREPEQPYDKRFSFAMQSLKRPKAPEVSFLPVKLLDKEKVQEFIKGYRSLGPMEDKEHLAMSALMGAKGRYNIGFNYSSWEKLPPGEPPTRIPPLDFVKPAPNEDLYRSAVHIREREFGVIGSVKRFAADALSLKAFKLKHKAEYDAMLMQEYGSQKDIPQEFLSKGHVPNFKPLDLVVNSVIASASRGNSRFEPSSLRSQLGKDWLQTSTTTSEIYSSAGPEKGKYNDVLPASLRDQNLTERQIFSGIMKRTAGENVTLHFPGRFNLEDHALGDHQLKPLREKLRANLSPTLDKLAQIPLGQGYVKEFDKILAGGPGISSTRIPEIQQWQSSMPPELKERSNLQVALGQNFNKTYAEEAVLMGMKTAKSPLGGNLYSDIQNVGHLGGKLWDLTLLQGKQNYFGEVKTNEDTRSLGSTGMKEIKSQNEIWSKILRDLIGPENRTDPRSILEHQYLQAFEEKAKQTRSFSARHKTAFATHPAQTEGTARSGLFYGKSSSGLVPNFSPGTFGLRSAAIKYGGKTYSGPLHYDAYEKIMAEHPEVKKAYLERKASNKGIDPNIYGGLPTGYLTRDGEYVSSEKAKANFGVRFSSQAEFETQQADFRPQPEDYYAQGLTPNFSKKKVLAEQIEAARKFLNPKEIGQLSRLSGADQYEEFIQRVMPLRKQGEFNAPSRKQLTKSLKEKTKIKSLEKLDYSSRIGTELAARLDIPSSNRGAPAITVHESRGRKNLSVGDVLSYENAVSLSDPSFSISQKASLAIAQRRTASGKDIKGKFPMATVVGNLQKKPSQREILQRQREWLEAGINPQRHSYLYDKTTQQPIVGGEEAMLVGHGVYVNKPIFGNKEDYLYSSGLVPNFAPNAELQKTFAARFQAAKRKPLKEEVVSGRSTENLLLEKDEKDFLKSLRHPNHANSRYQELRDKIGGDRANTLTHYHARKSLFKGLTTTKPTDTTTRGSIKAITERTSDDPVLQRQMLRLSREFDSPVSTIADQSLRRKEISDEIRDHRKIGAPGDPLVREDIQALREAAPPKGVRQGSDYLFRGVSLGEITNLRRFGQVTSLGERNADSRLGSFATSSFGKAAGFGLADKYAWEYGAKEGPKHGFVLALDKKRMMDRDTSTSIFPTEGYNTLKVGRIERDDVLGVIDLQTRQLRNLNEFPAKSSEMNLDSSIERLRAILSNSDSKILSSSHRESFGKSAGLIPNLAPTEVSRALKTEKALGHKGAVLDYDPQIRSGKVDFSSGGFVPNFSLRNQEIFGALQGGYEPGKVVPSPVGGVMNTAEQVKYVPGFMQPFINPPKDSEAGREHKKNAIRQTGINPYSRGFVPNFAPVQVYHGTNDPEFAQKIKATGLKGLRESLKKRSFTGTSFADAKDGYDVNSRGLFVSADLSTAKGYGKYVFSTTVDDSKFYDYDKETKYGVGTNAFYSDTKRDYTKKIKGVVGGSFTDTEKAEGSKRFLPAFPEKEVTKNFVISRSLKGLNFTQLFSKGHIPNFAPSSRPLSISSPELIQALPSFSSGRQLLKFLASVGATGRKGSSRMFISLDDKKGLKVALNKAGIAQNEVEFPILNSDRYAKERYSDILPKGHGFDENNFLWGVIEKLKIPSNKDFQKLTGKHRGLFLQSGKRSSLSENEELIKTFTNEYGVILGDFRRGANTGIGQRPHRQQDLFNPAAGEDYIKLLDIGFNKVVADKFYRFGARPQNGVWNFSEGMVPNFIKSPLQESIEREKKGTGLPLNQIYTDYVNTSKYRGPVVANKKDEPTRAALLRAVTSHPNPATAGASRGHIPNFMSDAGDIGTSISSIGFMLMMSGVGQKLNPALASYKKDSKDLTAKLGLVQREEPGLNKQVQIDQKAEQRANNAQKLHATRLDYLNKDLSKQSKLNRKIALAHAPLAAAFTDQKLVTGEAIKAELVRIQALKNLGITDPKALEHGTAKNKAEVLKLAKEKASAERAQQKAKDTAKAERDARKLQQKDLAKKIDQSKIQLQAARDAQKFFTTSIPQAEAYAGNAKLVGPTAAQLPESRTQYAERVKAELSKSISSLQGKVGGISGAEAAAKRAFEGKDFTSSPGGKSAAEKLYSQGQELRRAEKAQITAQLGAEKLKLAQANKVVADAAKANTASKDLPQRILTQEQAYQARDARAAAAKPGHEKNLKKLNQSTIAATLSYNAVQTSSAAHVAAQQKLTAANQHLTAQTQQAVVSHTAAGDPINARLTAASMALGLSRQAAGENASQQANLKANLTATGQNIATEQNKPFFGKGGKAANFIHQRGFGVGIAAQMGLGIAGEVAYGDDRSREGRKGKAAISGVGTVMGMAGMGAMFGPWGAAAGAIIGTGLALWDYSKKSKKNAEDYSLELEKLTEKQREGVAALRTYTEMTDALLNAYNRGASSTEIKSIEKNLTEAFSDIQDPALRANIAIAANDPNKLNEAMALLSESLTVTTRRAKLAEEMNFINKDKKVNFQEKKKLGKNIALAFPELKNEELLNSGESIEKILEGIGVHGDALTGMLDEINEGFNPDALIASLRAAFEFLKNQADPKAFTARLSTMQGIIIKENELIKKLTSSHERYLVTLQAQFEGNMRMSDLLSSSLAQNPNLSKFQSMDTGLKTQYESNTDRLAMTNAVTTQSFFKSLIEDLTGKNEGAISKETRELRDYALDALKNKTPFNEQTLKKIIGNNPTSSTKVEQLDKINRLAAELEKNTIEISEQNRLLIIQDQLRRMEIAEASRQKLRGQADFVTPNLFEDSLGKLFNSFSSSPGKFASAKAGAQRVEGLQMMEKMGFDFENTAIGKNFKNKIMADSFRTQAPLALRSLGMGEGDIETIRQSGFNQDISKAVIEKQNSAQADLMAQVIDAANLEKIAEKEREYKTKLFEAEQQARKAMVEAMGGNVDATYNLISSNHSLISSNLSLIGSNSAAAVEFKRSLEEHGIKMAALDVQRKVATTEGKAASAIIRATTDVGNLKAEYQPKMLRQVGGEILGGKIGQGTARVTRPIDISSDNAAGSDESMNIDLDWMKSHPVLVKALSELTNKFELGRDIKGKGQLTGTVTEELPKWGIPNRPNVGTLKLEAFHFEKGDSTNAKSTYFPKAFEKLKTDTGIGDFNTLSKVNLSAFMMQALGKGMNKAGISEMSMQNWKSLKPNEKAVFSSMAKADSGKFGVDESAALLKMLEGTVFKPTAATEKGEVLFNFAKEFHRILAETEEVFGSSGRAALSARQTSFYDLKKASPERIKAAQESVSESDRSNREYLVAFENSLSQLSNLSGGKLTKEQKTLALSNLNNAAFNQERLLKFNEELGDSKVKLEGLASEFTTVREKLEKFELTDIKPSPAVAPLTKAQVQNAEDQAVNDAAKAKFNKYRPTVPTIPTYVTAPTGIAGTIKPGENSSIREALSASIKMFGTPDRKESGAYRMSLHQSSREQEVYQQMMKESGMGGKFRGLVENPALKTAQSAYQSAIDLYAKQLGEKTSLETQELPLIQKKMASIKAEILANEEALIRSVEDEPKGEADWTQKTKKYIDSLDTARKEQEAQAALFQGVNLKLQDLNAALANDLPGVKSALQGLAGLKFEAQMDRLDERLANLGLELDMWKNPAQGLTLSMMEAKEKVLEQSIILEKLNTVLGESANLESERGPILELLIEAQRKQAEAAVKQAEMSQLTGAGTGKDVYEEKLRGIKEQLRRGEVSLGGAIGLEGLAKAEADLVDFKENIFNTMKEIREGMKSDIKDGFSQWALEGAKAEDVLKNIGRSFAKRLMDMAYDMSIGRMMDQLFSGTMFSGDFIPNVLADEKSGGGKIQRFNSGGYVQGPKRGIDSVKAYLAPGEFVLKEPATRSIRQKFGDSALTRLNSLGSPGMQSVSGFAEGGIVGPTKDPRDPLGLPMLLDEDPLFVFGKRGQRDVAGTASQAVRYGQVHSFTEKDKQAATVVFGETGPHLYKRMDVVGNTVRNRMDSPNYLPDESSVHGTLTRPGQFDALQSQSSDNMKKANAMSSFMKSPEWIAAGKPIEGDAGNAARDRQWTSMLQNVKWARGKEKAATHGLNQEDITAWQAALFYGSDKGTLSGRYPGITAYSSPVDSRNTWRTVPGKRMVNGKIIQLPDNDPGAALTQIGLDLKAHQTTLGGVQKGNVGGVAFHGYTSPVSGNFGSFVNDGAKAAALGNQTFMPFMQRINNDKVQKASAGGINNRDTLARNWRAVGGSAGWEGLSPEAKLEFNVNSAKTLRINDAGYSSSQQFLKNIQRKKEGGVVSGVGRGDRVPILAEPREFIFKRRTADAIGHEKLNELNSFPERFSIKRKMALGGTVTGGSVIGAPATTGEPTKPDWESTSSHPDVPMTHPQGENRINFSGRTPEMANMGADTADFGELNVHGLATQDKTWYTAGHMPSQTLEDVAERASATRLDGDTLSDAVKLQFVMNDKEKPTLGKFLGDHDKYTNYMLEDTENPQNELRNKRQDMLFDYVGYVQGEIKKRREAMQEFRDKVDQTVKAGWIQAAVAVGKHALGEFAKGLPDESELKEFMQSKGGAALGGAVAGFAVPAAMGGKDWRKHALIGSIAGAGVGFIGKWQAEKASEEFATGELQRASSEQLEAMAATGTDKYGNQFNEKQKEALMARAARLRVAETDSRNKFDVNRLKAEVGKARSLDNNAKDLGFTEYKLEMAQQKFQDYRASNKSDFAVGKSGSVDGWRFHMAPELSPGNKLSDLNYDSTQKKNIFRHLTSSLKERLKQQPRNRFWQGRRDGGLIGFQNGGGVKDTVPVMVAPGEFIVSRDAADEVGYSYLNKLNRYGSSAMRSDLPGFQEGGVVGRTGTDSGAGVAFSVPNHDGMSDVISQLIDIAQSIRDSIEASKEETSTKNQDSPTNESSGKSGGNITNNVNVTVNLSRGGETTEVSSSQESNGEEKEDSPKGKEKEEKFAVMLKGVVLQTIVEQQRPGGLLSD